MIAGGLTSIRELDSRLRRGGSEGRAGGRGGPHRDRWRDGMLVADEAEIAAAIEHSWLDRADAVPGERRRSLRRIGHRGRLRVGIPAGDRPAERRR